MHPTGMHSCCYNVFEFSFHMRTRAYTVKRVTCGQEYIGKTCNMRTRVYRLGMVNSKSLVSKVLLQIKRKNELN